MRGIVSFHAAVIGGGPTGAAVATRLAQQGHRVVIVEKERFPRFHIGESLIPCCMPLLEQLGAMPDLGRAGFLVKHAAEFVTADGSLTRRYPFAEGVVSGPASTWEVDRDRFDEILLENARRHGVAVRQADVVDFDVNREGVRVKLRGGDVLKAQLLLDASGQRSFVAGKLGLREPDPDLKNFAVYSHFEGAARASGEREGDISIVLVPHGWWWVIPLAGDRTSLGLVAPARSLGGRKPSEEYFLQQLASVPYLKERFSAAKRIAPVRTASDYSYRSRQVAGDRWMLMGDAAAFIDPVFSTGVYLGLSSAFRAATAADQALARGRFSRRAFRSYERWLNKTVDTYRDFVKGFYRPEFAEVMMHPSDNLQLRQAVTSLLAGHSDSLSVAWRIWIFRNITRLNKDHRLVPRLHARRQAAAQ